MAFLVLGGGGQERGEKRENNKGMKPFCMGGPSRLFVYNTHTALLLLAYI